MRKIIVVMVAAVVVAMDVIVVEVVGSGGFGGRSLYVTVSVYIYQSIYNVFVYLHIYV